MFNDVKIGTRLTGVLGLMVALLVAVVAIALWQMRAMNAATREIVTNWLPSVERVNQMNTGTSDFRILEFKHVLNTDDSAMRGIEQDMAKILAAFEDDHQAYVALISSDDERRIYDAFAAEWKQYLAIHDRVLAHSRKNENDKAKALLEGDSRKLFDDSSEKLVRLVELNSAGASASAKAAEAGYARAQNLLLLAAALGLSLAAATGTWLVRSIVRQLGGEPGDAAQVASAIAAGDLTRSIAVKPGDHSSLIAKLAAMQSSLTQVVANVRANAESVATASAQIAQGNHDLSQRTEEQASALQQTAATMEELGTTVRHNADSAQQANQLAQSASAVAARGGDVVGQVVTTMQGINESSRQIGDIIGVIDGIAFQTNILALNAAVEAARAGEQGRGFAVVAGEVRTLAQRSAEAAKEIKSLIGRSVEQVEQGTVLVDQAGQTMGEIVGSIRRVSDIVAEISASSVEQSSGVSQIGDAVNQMDQVTQQNAALVEEGAAAAESLKTQANQLVGAVAVFKLSQHGGSPSAADAVSTSRATRAERRSPQRAKNVIRPAFKAKPAPPASSDVPAAAGSGAPISPTKTGTDDWETF